MLRSPLKARESWLKTDRNSNQVERLTHLNREIDYLEAKPIEIKSRTNRALD